ncbi:MAG: ChaN family lipoprotein [Bacteroidota bacterium]
MVLRILFLLLAVGQLSQVVAQQKDAFVIYNQKGRKVNYKKLYRQVVQQDIVLFGEYHNNPIAHWLELELLQDLNADRDLAVGAEMLEADNQLAINNYFTGIIDQDGLDTMARLWPNYPTDYAPLVDFAKAQQLPFIATNIPRRYASLVYRSGGFEALDELKEYEKSWVAPLPIPFDPELPQYQNMLTMMEGHGSPALVKAQAIKDATMAHFILQNYAAGSLFLHFNGSYHSDFHEGILWYLQQAEPDLNYLTITTVEQDDIYELDEEHRGRADFIICVDSDMTKTY